MAAFVQTFEFGSDCTIVALENCQISVVHGGMTDDAKHTCGRIKTIQAHDFTMEYIDWGPKDGTAVVLIHGLGWDALRLWDNVGNVLANRGFRALALNLRGVGGTDATVDPYTTDTYAKDIEAFMAALGISQASVVGFSMGAAIAGGLLAQSKRVNALCLACGGLHGTEEGQRAVEDMLERAATLGPVAFATEQADTIFHPAWAAANPDVVADFKIWRAEMNQSALFRAFRSGYGVDMRATVQRAGVPVQVIAADQDPFCDMDDMRALAASIPGAQFDMIEECGHMATIEQLDRFNEILMGFLQSQQVVG